MKLWLLKRADGDWGYDEYKGFVVRANSETEARRIAYEAAHSVENSMSRELWWLDLGRVSCVEVTTDGAAEVVLASLNAG